MRIRLLSIAAVAILAAGLLAGPAIAATPATWYVDDDGTAGAAGCNGATPVPTLIQDAIDAAAAGDTVLVCPGAYRADVTVDKARLTLRSVQPFKARIVAPASVTQGAPLVVTANRVQVQWFRVNVPTLAPCATYQNAVLVQADDVLLRSLRVGPAGPTNVGGCGLYVGIRVGIGASATIRTTLVRDFYTHGIHVESGATAVIDDTSLRYWHKDPCATATATARTVCRQLPASEVNSALYLVGTATVTDTAISGQRAIDGWTILPVGIVMNGGSTVRRTTIERTGIGIQVGGSGNLVAATKVTSSTSYGIVVFGTTNVVRGATIQTSGVAGLYANASTSGNLLRNNTVSDSSGSDCTDASGNVLPAGPSDPIDNTWTGNTGATGNDTPDGICPMPI